MEKYGGAAPDVFHPYFSTFNFPLDAKADDKSGPVLDTAPCYSLTTTKNAIRHLDNVHNIGRNGQHAEGERMLQGSGTAVPRVSFDRIAFRQMLIRLVTACNIQVRAVDDNEFRQLLGCLAACVSSHNYLSTCFLVLTGHILLAGQRHRNSQAHADHRKYRQSLDDREIHGCT